MTLTIVQPQIGRAARYRRFSSDAPAAPAPVPVNGQTVPLLRSGRGVAAPEGQRDHDSGHTPSGGAVPAPGVQASAAPISPPPPASAVSQQGAGTAAASSRVNRYGQGNSARAARPAAIEQPAPAEAAAPAAVMATPAARPAVASSRARRFAPADDDEVPPSSFSAEDVALASGDSTADAGAAAGGGGSGDQSEVIGVIESIRTFNEWSVGTVWLDDTTRVKITGEAVGGLVEGAEYSLKGRWRHSDKHGESLDVHAASPHVRADRASIRRFMERHFQGVGPKTSAKYLADHVDNQTDPAAALERLREQLLSAPWMLDFSHYTSAAQFKNDEGASPMLAFVHRDLAMRVGALPGMKDGIVKLLAGYAIGKLTAQQRSEGDGEDGEQPAPVLDPQILSKCWAVFSEDPYAPIAEVPGYGFVMADAIGNMLQIPADAPMRIKALIRYATEEGCQMGGHVFLTERQLKEAISRVDRRLHAERTIQMGVEGGYIVADEANGQARYYTPELYDAETTLAERIAKMCEPATPLIRMREEAAIELVQRIARETCPHMVNGLDDTQARALAGILTATRRLHTLTAGPGCGKTALMEVLQAVLKQRSMVFVGPTGKSAKVLNNRLSAYGRSASTIHSRLCGSGRGDFQVNEQDPLSEDILVVDEASMADVEIADGVLAAVHDTMHVIMLGDVEQLPSVSPGAVLRDLLAIKQADHHRLTTTHRNSGGILEVIGQVRDGTLDCVDRPSVRFSHGLKDAPKDFPKVAQDYVDAVSRLGIENVILLMPKRKGDANTCDWNTTYANAQLREMCNPNAERISGSRLHVNDRVIIRANMQVDLADTGSSGRASHDAPDGDDEAMQTRVVNGDTGTIVGYERPKGAIRQAGVKWIRIKLDDGRMVDFPGAALDQVQHAYALTVHSAQGSEYKHVMAVVTPGTPQFINRAMIFTGFSRAQNALHIYGEDAVLRQIAATPMPPRNSGLVRRVMENMGASEDEIAEVEPTPVEQAPTRYVPAAPAGSRAARYGQRF